MIESVPAGLVRFYGSKVFTGKTFPQQPGSLHDAKPGIRGGFVVPDGCLDHVVPYSPERSRRLETGDYGVIRPAGPRRVGLPGKVRFKLEFTGV